MNENTNERRMEHVIDAIITRNQGVPNFALLLGSGASVTSGINSANGLIDSWRRKQHKRSGTRLSFKKWIEKQPWYKSNDEYSILFELMYDSRELRRAFVEEEIVNTRPGMGYMYLTNLLNDNVFNVVFTTNFDDLLSEACYLYSEDLRPIVSAHDSSVNSIRITSARPKIIKLHGDYLFDNIKNTMAELETLEANMKKKFMQFACEYGLVVVGYGGRDRSVMDILDLLVRHEDYFKQGIYWCALEREQEYGSRLVNLLKRDKVYICKTPGFDEFMAEIHHKAGLDLPEPVVNPMWMARDRRRLVLDVPKEQRQYGLIEDDINAVLDNVGAVMKGEEEAFLTSDFDTHVPSSLKAAVIRQQRGLESALELVRKASEEDSDDESAAYEYAETLARLYRKEELREFMKKSTISDDWKTYFLLHADDNEGLIDIADKVLSKDTTNSMARINRAIAFKRLKRLKDMRNDLSILEDEVSDINFLAGIAALRNQKDEMLKLLEKSLTERRITVDDIEMFPVFEDFHTDKDLLDLCDRYRKEKRPLIESE